MLDEVKFAADDVLIHADKEDIGDEVAHVTGRIAALDDVGARPGSETS